MASVMRFATAGLASSSHRRGVTPFVLLLKRVGNISAKSRTVVVHRSSEWIAATPLVLWLPTIARCAMRTCFSGCSSIRLMYKLSAVPATPDHVRGAVQRDELTGARRFIARPVQRSVSQRLGDCLGP